MPRDSLSRRLAELEARAATGTPQWVRIFQYEGETQEEAVAAYEAVNGPINNKKAILRVIINKPFPRLAVLETAEGGFKPYIAMMQRVGQTQDEARAEYEAKNGPVPEDSDVMFIRLVGVTPTGERPS